MNRCEHGDFLSFSCVSPISISKSVRLFFSQHIFISSSSVNLYIISRSNHCCSFLFMLYIFSFQLWFSMFKYHTEQNPETFLMNKIIIIIKPRHEILLSLDRLQTFGISPRTNVFTFVMHQS